MDKLKTFMSEDKIYKSPILSSALTHNKRIRFNFLTPNEYKIIPIKTKDDKTQNLLNNIDTFRKIYLNYNKKVKYSLDEMKDMSQQNRKFIQRYNNMVNKSDMANKNAFSDIKAEYEKQNYVLPNLMNGNNLFKSNLLLANNDNDLKKYINYGIGTSKAHKKAISFLEKINDNIDNDLRGENKGYNMNLFNNLNDNINNEYKRIYNPSSFYVLKKMSKEKWKEILTYKKEIRKLKNTIDSLPDIDYFFSSDNKDYLDTLRFFNSRNTSANFSTTLGNNNSTIFDKNTFGNKSNILNLRNISKFTFDENESKSINSRNKKVTFKLESNNTVNSFVGEKKDLTNKSLTQTINKPKKKKKFVKKTLNGENYRQTLENLYDKIANSDDPTEFDKKIRNFLRARRYKFDQKITKNKICNNMESLRILICKDDSIKKVIDYRKNMGHIIDNGNNNKESEIEKKMNEVEDQMIKAFSEFKN